MIPGVRELPVPEPVWSISVDAGGTFTDAIGHGPRGQVARAKVLSSGVLRAVLLNGMQDGILVRERWGVPSGFCVGGRLRVDGHACGTITRDEVLPEGRLLVSDVPVGVPGALVEVDGGEEAAVLAARVLTGVGFGRSLPAVSMRLATTRGTNALLERRGARVAFFVTAGFEDLLLIGSQQRPHLFRLRIEKPGVLYTAAYGVGGRLDADGGELEQLDEAGLVRDARAALDMGCDAACVAFMHAWRNDAHEQAAAGVLRACGFAHVTCSSSVAPTIKLVVRAQTGVVDAYLAALVGAYAASVERHCSGGLRVMTSAGGVVRSEAFAAKDSLLSGPAGGVAGARDAGVRSGFHRVLSFDMGGTSTDVARCADGMHLEAEHRVGDATIAAPAVGVESVAAGGGSVCWYDAEGQGTLRVGPASAGAKPGPACYGAGGPLTITDCNLLIGRIAPDRMGIPIDVNAAYARANELREVVRAHTGEAPELDGMLGGLIEIANERMAQAIREVSIARGYDASEHALVAFGGAGGQHACDVAGLLGIRTVLVPHDAGLLSAVGVAGALVQREARRLVLRSIDEAWASLAGVVDSARNECLAGLVDEGVLEHECDDSCTLRLRLPGQESTISVAYDGVATMKDVCGAFRSEYMKLYGYSSGEGMPQIESLMVVVRARQGMQAVNKECVTGEVARGTIEDELDRAGQVERGLIVDRETLRVGDAGDGPVLITEDHATTYVPAGWSYRVDGARAVVLSRGLPVAGVRERVPQAVADAVFLGRIGAIVSEMGRLLERTARSTNVKERLDYSCALLDARGMLIVNAPHIPVHLGALGECVRRVAGSVEMRPGDTLVTNHPAYGGSHLPDITLVTPVFEGETLVGYVANRAHHAEIGGMSPGSFPPGARCLVEEGVVIPPMHMVREGRLRAGEIEAVLRDAKYPSRALEENMADLRAQAAANALGARLLGELVGTSGVSTFEERTGAIHRRCAGSMRRALALLGDMDRMATERLDDGSTICVRVAVRSGAGEIDFSGTSCVHPGSLNAPLGVIRSAVLYVMRLLVHEDLPLCEGLLDPITLRVPRGMLNPEFVTDPAICPAVAAGNVETSQRVVDALLKAIGVAACSQGTMNNVIFGNERFSFYETICGGAGAGPGYDGAHGVHTHMTNTRITDPEILEHRYPLRVERFGLRRGSGGTGRWSGGDGVVRAYRFLEPVSLFVLSQHRASGPYGMEGGGDGQRGEQRVAKAEGVVLDVAGIDVLELVPGDVFTIETPGGGGWGVAPQAGNAEG